MGNSAYDKAKILQFVFYAFMVEEQVVGYLT